VSLPCAVCESFCIVPSTGTHHRLGDARAALQQAREVPTYGTYHTYHNTTICWLQNREIYITGTAPYNTGTSLTPIVRRGKNNTFLG